MSTATPEANTLGGSRALVAAMLALGTFMQVLDSTIANVSIPTIAGDLGASSDQGTWVITSFAVANGISLPLSGWLMQRFGVVRVFTLAVLMFTLTSFLCGMAWSLSSLVLFRILQGGCSGPMMPGSQTLLLSIFPPERRGTALAIWSSTTLVAPICGPLLGGHISDNYSWPWIFFINVPVGFLCAAYCWRTLKHRETPTRRLPIDTVGVVLLVIWVGALQIMLDTGKNADWFASPLICIEAIVALVSFIAFMIWELGEAHPIIDLSLFKRRNFALGVLAFCVGYAVFFGGVVLQPLWMQTLLGYTASWAGLVAAPSGMVAVLISPWVGRYADRVDPRIFATIAFLSFGISYLLRTHYTADASFIAYMLPLLVQGVGMSMFFVSLLNLIFDGVPPPRIPAAAAQTNFLRITSGAFATSIATTLWERRAVLHRTDLASATSAFEPSWQQARTALQGMGASEPQTLGMLDRVLNGQAYLLSTIDYFWISSWLCFFTVVLVWLTRRPRGAAHVAAAD